MALINDEKNDWRQGIAYIIETREHKNLSLVIDNVHQCLPSDWEVWIFHSLENFEYAKKCVPKTSSRKYKFQLLKEPINSLNDYNKLLLSEQFWEQFTHENLICFQVDTLINPTHKNALKNLCSFDYVGAPWADSLLRRWDYLPKLGGNGGFCYSKLSARLNALNQSQIPKQKSAPYFDYINEDIWFSNAFIEIKATLPSREVAKSLLVESSFSPKPFAVHKPWSYLSPSELQQLYTQIPNLKKAHINCVTALSTIPSNPKEDKHHLKNDNYRRSLLSYARDRMKNDNFHAADQALQISHSYFPEDPKTLNLQAMLAFSIGTYEQALNFAKLALNKQPNFVKAQENIEVIEKRIQQEKLISSEQSPEKFLMIHSLSCGLAFDLLNLLGHELLSEISHRNLVVHWGKNATNDSTDSEDIFNKLFFSHEFNQLSDIAQHQNNAYPKHWQVSSLDTFKRQTSYLDKSNGDRYTIINTHLLNRPERVVISTEFSNILLLKQWLLPNHPYKNLSITEIFRKQFKRHIKPKNLYSNKAKEYIQNTFQGQDFVAIHLRAYDTDTGKKGALPVDNNAEILSLIDKHHAEEYIFLITDDNEILQTMKKRYNNRLFSFGGIIHKQWIQGYDSVTSLKNTQKNLVEMLIAQQASHFYGSGYSYYSCCIHFLRQQNSSLVPFNILERYINPPVDHP